MSKVNDKIAYLRECANKYEATGKSPISDAEYDILYEEAKQEDPNNDFFDEVGGLDEQHIYGSKIKHKVIMGSLNKSKNIEDFLNWLDLAYPNDKILEFVVQYKIDGLSLSCIYNEGNLQTVVTRGNSVTGVDVTKNARFVGNIPNTIKCKDEVEIRGECFKDREDFYKNWVGEYANPRNFCSGSLNQLDAAVTKERGLDFIAYEIVRKDFDKEYDKISFLEDNGFLNLKESTFIVKGTHGMIAETIKKFMDSIKRDDLPFAIDGVVVKINNCNIAIEMGSTSEGRKPKSNRAVKFSCQQVITTIESVEKNVGRTGIICPVANLTPVRLNETTVKRVTLHNYKFIKELELNIGSEILIQKSGEIIPYVVRKVSDKAHVTQIVIPTECPSCESELEWDATHTTKVCTNEACPAQLDKSIEHWFKKIEVLGIGPGIIEKLTTWDNNLPADAWEPVESIADMYSDLKVSTDTLNELFGKKAFANILEAIDSVKEMPLSMFVEALGIGKIGRMSKDLTAIAPTIKDIDALTPEDIQAIKGFGPTKAKSFVKGWKKQRSEIARLLEYIKIKKEDAPMSNKLDGQSFCITGTLSKPRNDFVKDIEGNGGKFAGSVSKNLNFLICGEECGSKKDKAEKLGVKILSEEEFEKMIR